MPSATRPLPDKRADPRAQILKAAGEVFFREGFARSSIDMIASTARMSKQSIYELFPNKMVLFEAAVRDTLDAADRNLAAIHPTQDIAETLAHFARRLFAGITNPAMFGLFRANIVAANQFPGLADELHEYRLARSRKLASYLEGLIAEGRLAPVDPLAFALRFGGIAVEGSRYFLGTPPPSKASRASLAEAAANLFLHGYQGQVLAAGSARPAVLDTVTEPVLDGMVELRLSADKLAGLLAAARNEFLEHGYTGANIEQIAASVRSSKATIYRQFGNKEKLFRHVIELEISASSRADFSFQPGLPFEQAVVTLARAMLDRHLESENIRFQRLLIQECDLVPDLARRFHDVQVAVLAQALDRLLAHYDMPLPNEFASRAFYTMATYAVRFLTFSSAPDAEQREEHSRECARIFLEGIDRDR